MNKCSIFTVILLIVFIAGFMLPWMEIYDPAGKADVYTGFSIVAYKIQRYLALGLGILASLMLFCPNKITRILSFVLSLVSLGSIVCVYMIAQKQFTGSDHFMYGIYVVAGALLLQALNGIAHAFVCQASCCCCKKEGDGAQCSQGEAPQK